MALVSITIPDAQITRAVDALCAVYNYAEKYPAGGPPTRTEFARQCLAVYIKDLVISYERNLAVEIARNAVTVPDITVT